MFDVGKKMLFYSFLERTMRIVMGPQNFLMRVKCTEWYRKCMEGFL